MKTLLLTTAGNVVAAQLIEALAPWRDRIRIVGLNSEPAAEPNFRCDAIYLVPPTADRPGWTERVMHILRSDPPDMVLPTRDGDLVPLAGIAHDPAFAQTVFLTPGPNAASILVDKLATFEFARVHGLPFVETGAERPWIERLVARVGFPILAKPRIGTGSAGVRVVRSWSQVDALLAGADPVFQEYLGDRADLDLPILDHTRGMPLLNAYGGRRNLSMVGAVLPDRRILFCGASRHHYRGVLPNAIRRDDDPRVGALVLDMAAALAKTDFAGFFNVQAVSRDDGFSLPFEYNGRLPGIARPRLLLGLSEAPLIAQLLLGPDASALPGLSPAGRLDTIWRADFVAKADADSLAHEAIWHRRKAALPPVVHARNAAKGPKRTLMLSTCSNAVAAMLMTVLEPWRNRLRIVGLTAEAAAAANFQCDAVHLVPPTQDRAAWHDRVAQVLRIEKPDLVLPTRDGDLEGLAAIADLAEFSAVRFFTPGPRSAAMLSDKYAQCRFASDHSLAFAATVADLDATERLLARTGFPLLAKPRRGTGAQGIRIVRSREQALTMLSDESMVLQEYVGDRSVLDRPILDPALGMPFILALDQYRFLSAVGAVLPDRRVVYCGTIENAFQAPDICRVERVEDPAIEAMTNRLGAALAAEDFSGFFNLQAIRAEDGAIVPFEYNGRLAGAAISRRMLNLSELYVILHLLLDEELPAMPGPAPAGSVAVVPRAEILPLADAAAIAQDGVWHRRAATA